MAPGLLPAGATMETIAVPAGPMPAARAEELRLGCMAEAGELGDGSFAVAFEELAALAVAAQGPFAGTSPEVETVPGAKEGDGPERSTCPTDGSPLSDGGGALAFALVLSGIAPVAPQNPAGGDPAPAEPENAVGGTLAEASCRPAGGGASASGGSAAPAGVPDGAIPPAVPAGRPVPDAAVPPAPCAAVSPEPIRQPPAMADQPVSRGTGSDAGDEASYAPDSPPRAPATRAGCGTPVSEEFQSTVTDDTTVLARRPGGRGAEHRVGPDEREGASSLGPDDGPSRPSPFEPQADARSGVEEASPRRPETAARFAPVSEVSPGGSATSGTQAPSTVSAPAASRLPAAGDSAPAGHAAAERTMPPAESRAAVEMETVREIARLLDIEPVRSARLGSDGELRVAVHRDGLGHVEVRVRVEEQAVHAALLADHERAREVLTGHRPLLEAALGRQNLRLEGFSVEVGYHPQDRPRGGRERFEPAPAAPVRSTLAAVVTAARHTEPARQVAGGLDLHV